MYRLTGENQVDVLNVKGTGMVCPVWEMAGVEAQVRVGCGRWGRVTTEGRCDSWR